MKVITPHPRFQAFVANIRHRKGAKAMGKEPTEPLFFDFDGGWIGFFSWIYDDWWGWTKNTGDRYIDGDSNGKFVLVI